MAGAHISTTVLLTDIARKEQRMGDLLTRMANDLDPRTADEGKILAGWLEMADKHYARARALQQRASGIDETPDMGLRMTSIALAEVCKGLEPNPDVPYGL